MITLTLTPFIVLGINYKGVIGAFWDYTCTPEITFTLLNCFQINFQKLTLTLTLLTPVLGGAALLPFSAPAVYKNPVP